MNGYGKKRYPDDDCHVIDHLTTYDGKRSWAIYRTYTPFCRRRHKMLTTNKAAARRANRIKCDPSDE